MPIDYRSGTPGHPLGQGGKTRAVLLPPRFWSDFVALRGEAQDGASVFRSRRGGHLVASSVDRIVRAAARRARVEAPVSSHWFRHGHIHLVQHFRHTSVTTSGRYLHARPTEGSSGFLPI